MGISRIPKCLVNASRLAVVPARLAEAITAPGLWDKYWPEETDKRSKTDRILPLGWA